MVLNCGVGQDFPWTARKSNQSILKEISPGYSLEGLMLKLKLQYFGHLMRRAGSLEKTLMLGKIEGRRRKGRQRMRWLHGDHQFLGSTQTHVHWVGDAIQPSHPLSSPSPPTSNLSQHQGLFRWVSSSHQVAQSIGASVSTSVLPMNIQDWFPLGWTGWISLLSRGLSTPQFKSVNSLALSFLYGPTLTSIHDHWKNHRFDWRDLFWEGNVSAF